MHHVTIRSLLSATVALLLSLANAGAAAQTDEIVVTVRKREEALQKVPIAITSISAEQIERNGVRELQDVVKASPSVQFDEGFAQQDTRVTIRGLTNMQGRSQVAFLVDGVDVTTEAINSSGSGLLVNQRLLSDVERVEIVKGPQSALFGRAAFAGAINYVTASPGDELEASAGGTLASDSQFEARGMVSGPVTDTLGLRANAVAWSEDGFYRNAVSGADVGGGEGVGVSLAANWLPTEALSVKARIAWSDDEYDQRAVAVIPNDTVLSLPDNAVTSGAFPPSAALVPAASTYGSAAGKQVTYSENPLTGNDYPGTDLEILRATLVIDWDWAGGLVSSYTGATDADSTQFFDGDRIAVGRPDTSNGNQELNWRTETRQFSQELRWASAWSGPFQLTLGGLYWHETRRQDDQSYVAFCMPMFGPCPAGTWQQLAVAAQPIPERAWRSETDHMSLYGLAEWDFAENFKISLESRWVTEDFETRIFPASCNLSNAPGGAVCPPGTPVTGEVDSDYHTPKVTLEWTPTEQALVYLSVGKGQKPGGITQAPGGGTTAVDIENLRFDPEKMWAYELGGKFTLEDVLGGTLRLNPAVFFQDYSDKQASTNIIDTTTGLPTARILNAAGAEVRGLELEAVYEPDFLEGLVVSLAYTYLDTEYTSFAGEANALAQIVALAQSCPETETALLPVFPGGPLAPRELCLVDRTGNELERAPENALVAGIAYEGPLPVAGLDWNASVSAQYTDERFADDLNYTKFDSYWNVDASLGLRSDRWDALLFVDNVFDDDTITTGLRAIDFANFATSGFRFVYIGGLPNPRVTGLRVNVRF